MRRLLPDGGLTGSIRLLRVRGLVLISRLVFTDGEKWRLLFLPESLRSGCDK